MSSISNILSCKALFGSAWIICAAMQVVGTAYGATTNYYLNIPYDSVPGTDPNLQTLHVASRLDFTNRPVFIYVHGGGWKNGDKDNTGSKDDYALDHGYVFASVNYRLTTNDVVFPAHVQDVAAAIAWRYRNVATYGGDPRQLYLNGHSAGSHLVALVASDGRWLGAHGLTPAVFRAVIPNDTEAYDLPFLSLPSGELGPTHTGIFGFDPGMWRFSSPAHHVAGGKAIPPQWRCATAPG